jgi:excisionase family DNA binding protein
MNDHLLDQLLHELAQRLAAELARLALPQAPAGDETHSPWMSLPHAASYLDWPKQRLYKLTAAGAIPHYKQDGRLLFHRAEVDAWLTTHAQPVNRLALPPEQS